MAIHPDSVEPPDSRQRVLKLDPLDSSTQEQEFWFDLSYQLSLSTAERFELMFQKSRLMAETMARRGYRKPFEVFKRT